jgi:hypothetical protein
MQKFVTFILLIGFLTVASPALSEILFYDGCEDNSKVPMKNGETTAWYKNNHGNVLQNKLGVSYEQSRYGKGSYRFYLGPYTSAGDWASDCELKLSVLHNQAYPSNFTPGKEYWMGYSIYVPQSQAWPETDIHPEGGGHEWGLLWQFHGSGNACDIGGINPVAAAYLSQNTTGYASGSSGYRFKIHGDTRECLNDRNYEINKGFDIDFPRGKWVDYVLNFKFTGETSGGGFYKVWQDGQLVINDKGINMYNLPSNRGPYFVFGVYAHMVKGFTVYFDEIRVGDANSSYNEVAPAGTKPLPLIVDDPTPDPEQLNPPVLSIVGN